MTTRRCGYCESAIQPFEVGNILGIPFVHRYRCGCAARFDITTTFGRWALILLNVAIVGAVLLVPHEKVASESDRFWILAILLGVQVPAVAIVLSRSRKSDRLHSLLESPRASLSSSP